MSRKAFIFAKRHNFFKIHVISKKKIEILVASLRNDGKIHIDKRGLHPNRPWKFDDDTINLVINHKQSFLEDIVIMD